MTKTLKLKTQRADKKKVRGESTMRKLKWVMPALLLIAGLAVAAMSCAPAAKEAAPADFYKGQTVVYAIGADIGSATDLALRAMADVLPKHIGATVAADNWYAAGPIQSANEMYNAKPDGLTILGQNLATLSANQIFGASGVAYNVADFVYLAGVLGESHIFVVSPKGSYQSINDLKAAKGLKFGTVSPRGNWSLSLHALTAMFGLDAKIVTGFKSADLALALASGEVDGAAWTASGAVDQAKKGLVRPLFVISSQRHPGAPDLPALTELVSLTKEQQDYLEMVRYFDPMQSVFLPPGIPADRVEFLREAFDKVIKDPQTIATLEKVGGYTGVKTMAGKELTESGQALVEKGATYNSTFTELINRYKP